MSDDRVDAPRASNDKSKNADTTSSEAQERIRNLRARARMGAWGLAAFVIVSVLSIPDSYLLPALSESIRRFLGSPPPSNLISVALAVYAFSALTLILARIAQGSGTYKGWSHLFYISAFYIFFGFAGTLRDTYWAVFLSGLLIMGLENYLVRTFISEEVKKEERNLEKDKLRGRV
ncbi:MAG: menaquinol oxidoreductase [bacterium]|nr:menaquinol oxidoreductase [bacterium]